jgi:hypothetical protein
MMSFASLVIYTATAPLGNEYSIQVNMLACFRLNVITLSGEILTEVSLDLSLVMRTHIRPWIVDQSESIQVALYLISVSLSESFCAFRWSGA